MKSMNEALFTGGSKKNLMTGGEFLTYCHDGADTIVFLSHVPSLRSYKSDEAKASLEKIAWVAANDVAKNLDPDGKKKLMVGLRGISSYGSVLQGKNGEDKPSNPQGSKNRDLLLPAFAPTAIK